MAAGRRGDLLTLLALAGFLIGTVLVAAVMLRFVAFYWWGPPSLALTAGSGVGFAWLMGKGEEGDE